MTDNEIKKALKEWSECGFTFCNVSMPEFSRSILSLIDRLQAENEKLNTVGERMGNDIALNIKHINELEEKLAKAESDARRKFAKRLKNIYENDKRYDRPNAHTLLIVLFTNIDNLLKKMESESK